MAKLTKSERLHLLNEWLEIWRCAGRPNLECISLGMESSPYSVEVVETVYDGNHQPMRCHLQIRLGERHLTPLFCMLTGRKLRKNGSVSYGKEGHFYKQPYELATDAARIQREAAIAHHDIDALVACESISGLDKAQIEVDWLALETAKSSRSRPPIRL